MNTLNDIKCSLSSIETKVDMLIEKQRTNAELKDIQGIQSQVSVLWTFIILIVGSIGSLTYKVIK